MYNLFNSSMAVVDMPTIQDGYRNTWLEISQVTVEKYGRLIYVNANKPRHRMMCTRRVRRSGGSREVCWPNVAKLRTGVATWWRLTYQYIALDISVSLQ